MKVRHVDGIVSCDLPSGLQLIEDRPLVKSSSCSTIYIDDSTVSQPNLKNTIKCVALATYYHIRNRTADRTLDIFDEKLHPLTVSDSLLFWTGPDFTVMFGGFGAHRQRGSYGVHCPGLRAERIIHCSCAEHFGTVTHTYVHIYLHTCIHIIIHIYVHPRTSPWKKVAVGAGVISKILTSLSRNYPF